MSYMKVFRNSNWNSNIMENNKKNPDFHNNYGKNQRSDSASQYQKFHSSTKPVEQIKSSSESPDKNKILVNSVIINREIE